MSDRGFWKRCQVRPRLRPCAARAAGGHPFGRFPGWRDMRSLGGPPTPRNRSHRGHRSRADATPGDLEMNGPARLSPVSERSGDTSGDTAPIPNDARLRRVGRCRIPGHLGVQGWPLVGVFGRAGAIASPTGFLVQTCCFARCTLLVHTSGAAACQFAVTNRRASPPFPYSTPNLRFRTSSTGWPCAVRPFLRPAPASAGPISPTENRHG